LDEYRTNFFAWHGYTNRKRYLLYFLVKIELSLQKDLKPVAEHIYMNLKTILFLLSFLLISRAAYTQHLTGKYAYPLEHGNRTITFENDHFTDETIDGTPRTFGHGIFKIKDSLLLLTYKEIKNKVSSNYTFNEQVKKNEDTQVSLQLKYEDGSPAQALIAIFDGDHRRLVTYSVDTMGQSSFIIDHKYDSMTLSITGIPYDLVKIPVKRLKNRYTKITAVLKERRLTYMQPGTVSLIMEKSERGDLILNSKENNDTQLWRKVN